MSRWSRLALAIGSGLLLAVSFPSFNLSLLAWIGFVPLFLAIRGLPARRAALYGWMAGFVWQIATIYWIPATISNFTAIPPLAAKGILVLLAGFSAYPFLILAAFCEWTAARGFSRLLVAPLVWVFGEWLRVVVIAGFPWNPIGNTQINMYTLPLAQAADLGGVYLLSAVIVLANVAIAEAIFARREQRRGAQSFSARMLLAAACPLFLLSYGLWRLDGLREIPYTGSLRIGVAQGNIAQDEKWNTKLRDRIYAKYVELTGHAADAGAQLVVWPEAALPFYFQQNPRSRELERLVRERGIDLLVGAPGVENRDGTGNKPYNQAWLLRSDGEVQGPYDKIQLVPFGEYIPFMGLFGMVDVAVQSVGQLGQGTSYTIFDTVELAVPETGGNEDAGTGAAKPAAAPVARRARFATLICYEGIFPTLTRRFATEDPDFLVNISNDAWYGDTSAPYQHLAMAAMRSIENRLPMVRSTNTGISAFITDEGSVGNMTQLFHEDMVVETLLVREVWSFYREYGDVFLHLCQAGVVLLLIAGLLQGRVKPSV